MGAVHTYSLLFFCIFIKTSIFSSISFCISFRRESKARIIIWKGFMKSLSPASLCKPLGSRQPPPQASSLAPAEGAHGAHVTCAASPGPSPCHDEADTGRAIRGLSKVSR